MDGATATGSRSTRTVTEANIRRFETRLQDPGDHRVFLHAGVPEPYRSCTLAAYEAVVTQALSGEGAPVTSPHHEMVGS